jgi:cell wall-associated NlpC family hydrolase
MTAPTVTPVLSSFFGKPLLEDPRAAPLLGTPLAGGGQFEASPDQQLMDLTVPLPSKLPAQFTTRNEPGTVPAPPGAALPRGDAAAAVDNAMGFVGSMYEWGGTGADGRVDCSGLLYVSFNRAGIKMPRYRAVDYGHMGAPVSVQDARPGDVVYFDNPGTDTDHVGLYIGNGKYVQAPQPGQQVQVSTYRGGGQIRRLLPDSAFHGMPTDPNGNLTFHGDNQVFTASRAPADHPGVQADPLAQLAVLDNAMSLDAIEGPTDLSGILDSFATATPDSIFGRASRTAATLTPAPAAFRPSGGAGITVGQAAGLSPAEAWIIDHESDGLTHADNPHSTAFGFGQLLEANRKAYGARFGFDPDTTDPGQQLTMFRAYVRDRYGTAENAQRFWQKNGWY